MQSSELFNCPECEGTFMYRKTLGRHVRDVHKMNGNVIEKETICGCGKKFENTRYSGGPRKGGPRQIYCSPECTHKATNVRFYGLTLFEYCDMLREQGFRCAICKKHVDDELRFLAVDHEHVPGFEEMKPEQRKRYVRGLLCIICNKHRMAGTDLRIAQSMVSYLQSYLATRSEPS